MRKVVCEQKLRPNIPNRWQSCEVRHRSYILIKHFLVMSLFSHRVRCVAVRHISSTFTHNPHGFRRHLRWRRSVESAVQRRVKFLRVFIAVIRAKHLIQNAAPGARYVWERERETAAFWALSHFLPLIVCRLPSIKPTATVFSTPLLLVSFLLHRKETQLH